MLVQNQPHRIIRIHTPSTLHNWVRGFLLDVRAANCTDATIEFYREKPRQACYITRSSLSWIRSACMSVIG
jgi:hypothetical protein